MVQSANSDADVVYVVVLDWYCGGGEEYVNKMTRYILR